MERYEKIERSIVKRFRKSIWSKFISAIKEYKLIQDEDKIAVCISGGKDSMLMAKCLQHLQKYSELKFETEYIVMDPGYNEENRQQIIENSKLLNIPINIFESPIFDIVTKVTETPCYLCARMRRGYLYRKAKKLGCNKIALGHHFNDVIETVLMSMLYAAEIKTMMPKLHSTKHQGMELIRPIYKIREEDIISWTKYNDLNFIQCACSVAEKNNEQGTGSKRQEMKLLIKELKEVNPNIDTNIFKSIHNVNLETVIGYRKGNEYKSFLDDYNAE